MKKQKLLVALTLCALAVPALLGCGSDEASSGNRATVEQTSSESEKLVGEWKWSDGSTSQYLASGTWVGADGTAAKWEIEGDLLVLSEGPLGFGMSFRIVEFDEDRIVLEQIGNGKALVGTRVK